MRWNPVVKGIQHDHIMAVELARKSRSSLKLLLARNSPLTLSHSQEWSISNFPCSLTRNIASPSMKNLAFHSLHVWQMITLPLLTTSLIHFSLKGWENALFELGSERVLLLYILGSVELLSLLILLITSRNIAGDCPISWFSVDGLSLLEGKGKSPSPRTKRTEIKHTATSKTLFANFTAAS